VVSVASVFDGNNVEEEEERREEDESSGIGHSGPFIVSFAISRVKVVTVNLGCS